jgi:hypothetical protein
MTAHETAIGWRVSLRKGPNLDGGISCSLAGAVGGPLLEATQHNSLRREAGAYFLASFMSSGDDLRDVWLED